MDPQFSAVTIAQRGAVRIEEIYGERIELNPFPIVALIRIPALEIAVRRFNILDREQVRARAEMAEQEDTEILAALHTAATRTSTSTTGQFNGTADARGNYLTKAALANTYAQIEQFDAPVTSVVMHARDYRDIRNWDGTEFDPVTRKELLKTGYMGNLWNSALRITKKATFGRILACADPEFLGVISVRIDLDQMESPKPERLQYGWVFFEYIGVSVVTDVGVCELQLARPGSIYEGNSAFDAS